MKPFTSTNIKPLLSATLLIFLFEGCMHSPLAMNMDVEQREVPEGGDDNCVPGVVQDFMKLMEDEHALSEIKDFLDKHTQTLKEVYEWEEKDYKQKYTLIHCAAEAGRLDAVRQLIEMGIPADITTSDDVTPLMLAARSGSLDVVKYLVESGAKVDAKDINGSGVIHYAAGNDDDDPEPLKFLIGKKAPVDARDDFGFTILNVAAQDNLVDITKYIVQEDWGKKLIEAEDTKRNTPLHVAAYFGSEDVAKVLLDAGAKDVKNKSQKLASQLAMPCFPDVQQLILLSSHGVSAP